jgi:hypothetical protein
MEIHGLKGIKYLLKIKAISVISKSKIPFIFIQALPKADKEVVTLMKFLSEDKVFLGATASFAKLMNANLGIIAAGYSDEILTEKVMLNLSFAKRFLTEKQISFTVNETTGSKNFQSQIKDFTELVALINHYVDSHKNLFGKNFDKNIITNQLNFPLFVLTTKNIADSKIHFHNLHVNFNRCFYRNSITKPTMFGLIAYEIT